MALNCLQIIKAACKRLGMAAPNAVVASTDLKIIQMLALLEEEGQELATRHDWESLQTEATFATVATQVQTTLAAVTTGFDYIVNDTIWNRTLRRPVYGPKSQQEWQQAKASQLSGPFNSFRIISDAINFDPVPGAGESCYFEYMSRYWVSLAAGSTSDAFGADADTVKLDGQLMTLGLIWRWKAAKGFEYGEDYAKYERRLADAMGRDAGKAKLNLSGGGVDIVPVIGIPSGSWSV